VSCPRTPCVSTELIRLVVQLCCCVVLQHLYFLCWTYCASSYSSLKASSTLSSVISFSSMRVGSWAASHTQRTSWLCCEFCVICSGIQLARDSLPNTAKSCCLLLCQSSATPQRNISRFANKCFWKFCVPKFFVQYQNPELIDCTLDFFLHLF